jgi:cytochrome P450 / NADPH-cytochrome P450 reductase
VLPAFAGRSDGDARLVQHRLWQERARVAALLGAGAYVFVCDDGQRIAPAVRATLARIHQAGEPLSEAQAAAWVAGREREGRYAADVVS